MNTQTVGRIDVLLGASWGDEGKGKYTDLLAEYYDVIARFQGGPNAGHTIYFTMPDGTVVKVTLHQASSGILAGKLSVSGDGMVLDMVKFREEVNYIMGYRPDACNFIKIARDAGIILPIHILLDIVSEVSSGSKSIGSTKCGIGPAYEDQTGRRGPKFHQLLQPDAREKFSKLQQRYVYIVQEAIDCCQDPKVRKEWETKLGELDADLEQCLDSARQLAAMVEMVDCGSYIRSLLDNGSRVLAEGAQGMLLDRVYGKSRYVTSSITSPPGVPLGLGVSFRELREVSGVFKAYCTRVGNGPFPTEFHRDLELNGFYKKVEHPIAHLIQLVGREFGSTTGRPRRCGWLDLPLLKEMAYLGGFTRLLMTMIDVFNGFDEIEVCVGYEEMAPDIFGRLGEAKPIFQKIPWGCHVTPDMKTWTDLPKQVQNYINMIEEYVGVPIEMVSTGPERDQVAITRSRTAKALASGSNGSLAGAHEVPGDGSLLGLAASETPLPRVS